MFFTKKGIFGAFNRFKFFPKKSTTEGGCCSEPDAGSTCFPSLDVGPGVERFTVTDGQGVLYNPECGDTLTSLPNHPAGFFTFALGISFLNQIPVLDSIASAGIVITTPTGGTLFLSVDPTGDTTTITDGIELISTGTYTFDLTVTLTTDTTCLFKCSWTITY